MPRAAGLRAERDQPRAEHGRGCALLRHRRRRDGRARPRRAVDRRELRGTRDARRRRSRCSTSIVEPLSKLLAHLTSLPAFPEHTLFNVNIPGVPASEIKGVKLTKLGRRTFYGFDREDEGSVGPAHLLDRRRLGDVERGGGDRRGTRCATATSRVTPLHLDVTFQARLDDAETLVDSPVGRAVQGRAARGSIEELREKGVRDMAVLRALRPDAAAPVRADRRAPSRVRGHAAADRQRADHQPAVGARAVSSRRSR